MSTTKLIFLQDLSTLDYAKIGLKCGIEIHQQLNTGKLFSPRPCEIVPNDSLNKEVTRLLRFSLSETGESDKAAEAEFKKQKYNIYRYNDEIASLVDLDEEPPIGPNSQALNTGVQIGQMMDLKFFDSIQFMRKLIIDGSVTSGFQRTAMLGIGGRVETSYGDVGIHGINVEEDSCRAIERTNEYNIFSLDRQGIPLIEITTAPDAKTPEQVYELASKIGTVLRSFSTTRRGLGTIRQDLNISITGGSRIEIKGAQNLKLVREVVDAEIRRQIILLSIKEEVLEGRGVKESEILETPIVDVTSCFENCDSSILKKNLEVENSAVLGIKLKGMKGIFGHELHEGYRFGSEVSQRNKSHFPLIRGLFHADELPKYGIEAQEVDLVSKKLDVGDQDGFLLLVYEKNYARDSLENIKSIIVDLLQGVPSEVRQVDPKGTLTTFLRPMPGSARMYPETDVLAIPLDRIPLEDLKESLPELYDVKINRVKEKLSIDEAKTKEFLDYFSEEELYSLLKTSNKKAQELYSIVFDIPKDIKKRDKVEPLDLSYSLFHDLLELTSKEGFSQKVIRDIFLSLYKDKLQEVSDLKSYLEKKELLVEQLSDEELKEIVEGVISKNSGAPFGALMGLCVKEVAGKADGKRISSMLKLLMS